MRIGIRCSLMRLGTNSSQPLEEVDPLALQYLHLRVQKLRSETRPPSSPDLLVHATKQSALMRFHPLRLPTDHY